MAKVLKEFQDKYTKIIYQPGDSYEHKNVKRIASLVGKGYLEQPDEESRGKASE